MITTATPTVQQGTIRTIPMQTAALTINGSPVWQNGPVTGLTLICIFAACCGVAPIYSGITWVGQQLGLSLSVMGDLEIYSWDAALAHTGTYVRASLLFSSVAAIPAVIILRLVAFERVRLRKAVTASPPAPPEDPAA